MYKKNGKEVTREEFLEGAAGFKAGDVFIPHTGMQPFISPIDGKRINNNDQLSAHNRAHDVYQLGDDIKKQRDGVAKLKREETLDIQRSK